MWCFCALLCASLAVAPTRAASLFDFTEFDDPFSTLAQVNRNGLFRNTAGAECETRAVNGDGRRHGVCKSPLDCKLTGGRLGGRGTCALQQCCVYEGLCDSVSSKKVSYFRNPGTLPTSNECVFTVKTASSSVCQMRLDFEEFRLSQPTQMPGTPPLVGPYSCRRESLRINTPNDFPVPTLCGNNDGQHMYIPVNATVSEQSIRLVVRLNGGGAVATSSARWRIRVTQLECPARSVKGSLAAAARDYPLLAPAGCLQYFTAPTGNVTNFGYDRALALAANHYASGLDYAICFRRTPNTCGMRFTAEQFQLALTCENDYLFIPEAELAAAAAAVDYKFCNNVLNPTVPATDLAVLARQPTPLYIHFRTDATTPDASLENGFLLDWEVPPISNCV